MNMHYDLTKAEIATRLKHAENRRTAKLARTRHGASRWQRLRST